MAPEPDDVQRASDAATAAEVLRPALLLWITAVVVLGAWRLIDANFLLERRGLSDANWNAIGSALLAAIVLVFALRDRTSCRVFARLRRGTGLLLTAGITCAVMLWLAEYALADGSAYLVTAEHRAGWPLWRSLVTSALLPAVVEETMFRGMVLQRFRRVFAWPLAVAAQAALFAVLHWDQFWLPHFLFGCIAGVLRVTAGGLWPCLTMHFVWNGVLVLAAYGLL